jgi:hypothetical protein
MVEKRRRAAWRRALKGVMSPDAADENSIDRRSATAFGPSADVRFPRDSARGPFLPDRATQRAGDAHQKNRFPFCR